jgi:hypothetical protein
LLVFVTLSKKVAITETKTAGKLTYKIQGVQVPTRTNRRSVAGRSTSTRMATGSTIGLRDHRSVSSTIARSLPSIASDSLRTVVAHRPTSS